MIILKKGVAGLSAKALERFALRARRAARLPGRVTILLTSSAEMHSLNRQFRKKDRATDVLSFPYEPPSNGAGKRTFAGEIAISADIASENAVRLGHSAAVEVKVLALHGILHLAGFDHERDNGKMARKEASLRRSLGLPSSLTERSEPPNGDPEQSHLRLRLRRTRRTA